MYEVVYHPVIFHILYVINDFQWYIGIEELVMKKYVYDVILLVLMFIIKNNRFDNGLNLTWVVFTR